MTEQAKTRILVIDDEESIRYAVDAGLDFLGDYDVHFAEDGAKGIEGLKSLSPDLVLVDLVLPSISGMEILEAIRKDPDIKRPDRVVLMTGHANPFNDQHLDDVGVDKILSKPFKLEQLKNALFD
ncbi:MAG: response regulator [Chloroflexi bacterium]|nr:response regulator [Chloroflexota bacterium]MBT5627287.1 response regulator [Chloroflexota bacterium]